MSRWRHSTLAGISVLGLSLLGTGCVSMPETYRAYQRPYRSHPEAAARSRAIRAPLVIPPDIKIYALSAGGVEELRDDWSAAGRDNVLKALRERLRGQRVELRTPALDKETLDALEEIHALFRAVSLTIFRYTYSTYAFHTKLENFDYSVGSIDRILQKYGADGLILVYGFDQISTDGRRALQTLGAILPFVSGPSAGTTGLSVALVDRSGTILWYMIDASEGRYDLRDPESASGFVARVLTDFPRLGQ